MARERKVVWYEGMTLDPHHFQQWDRFHRDSLNARFRSLAPYDWGLTRLDIDTDALTNGQVSLRACCGVTADVFPFEIPDIALPSVSRSIESHFSPTEKSLAVLLAIPLEVTGGRNCRLDASSPDRLTRFTMETIGRMDENTGVDERSVPVARPNFSILFGDESVEGFSTIKIGEIERSSTGSFILSSRYVPPTLCIEASENLMNMTRRLLEVLTAKGNALSAQRRQSPSGQLEIRGGDASLFWLLTINSVIPVLHYYFAGKRCHPEALYLVMQSLAGQLITFSPGEEIQPRDLPLYDHANPAESFWYLDGRIRTLLENLELVSNFVNIPLEKRNEYLWVGRVPEAQLFQSARFFLKASGEVSEKKVIEDLPRKLKIADPEEIHRLATAAVLGLRIELSVRPPAGLPSRQGLQYFRIEQEGQFWEGICRSSSIAVLVPAEFNGLKLEIVAVKGAL